ncbi:MAG TPA: hypothetical protein VHE34_16810 [Puia sp.]|uniref:hypothetical protein n=1 Tax=Puia sp. TaxID=2045100 RepID=UPI002C23F7EC|nr:hypothetical protein [Puia sp.]HVU96894.1 hypothetical protein [Puia sp.]
MRKFVSVWIEGNGTMQAVIRTLMFWAQPKQEHTKLQLLKAVEKGNDELGPYTLQYAIDRRKKMAQWIFLHIPLVAFSALAMLLMAGALSSQNQKIILFNLANILCYVFLFRLLFFSLYLESYRIICHAADAIWKERSEILEAQKVNMTPQPDAKAQFDQLDAQRVESFDPDEVKGDLPHPGKGVIPLFLLNELIKQEIGRPNIYSGNIHETILLHSDMSGCRPKNILSKVNYYKSRKSIILGTENARTTHRKYMEKLQHHYEAIGDADMAKAAAHLLCYLGNNLGS